MTNPINIEDSMVRAHRAGIMVYNMMGEMAYLERAEHLTRNMFDTENEKEAFRAEFIGARRRADEAKQQERCRWIDHSLAECLDRRETKGLDRQED